MEKVERMNKQLAEEKRKNEELQQLEQNEQEAIHIEETLKGWLQRLKR